MKRFCVFISVFTFIILLFLFGCDENRTKNSKLQYFAKIELTNGIQADIDTARPKLDFVDSHHAAELIAGIPKKAQIIGRWKHKEDCDTLTIYEEGGHYYVAFRENLKWFLVIEMKSYYWEMHRAFSPIKRPLGDRAHSYYRIVDGRLLERPCDGSGDDYWFEPVE